MSNPWEEIDLKDYESHMSLADVYQLQGMNEMMKEQFYTYGVRSLMILGVAGGNGLEHIDKASFQAVYGVDINQCYLEECRTRYKALEGILQARQKILCKRFSTKSGMVSGQRSELRVNPLSAEL